MHLIGSRFVRLASAACVIAVATLAANPPPRPAPERDVVVANRSDRTINEIYASPSSSDDWGPDRLGDATIEPGKSRRVAVGPGRECGFDLEIIYHDASREERRGVDVCRNHLLAFDASRAVSPPGLDAGEHRVVIVNQDNRPIQQVLISPAESGDWGDDRLLDSLSVGAMETVSYRGTCLADMRVVFDNRSAEERRGLDLCALGGITILPGWTTSPTTLQPTALAQPMDVPLTVMVVNHSGHSISELHVNADASHERGADLLGSALLEEGGQIAVDIARPRGACRFTARVVYGGKIPDQDISGLDLCREPTFIVPPRA